MTLYFRRSKKIAPGVRLNLSNRGIGISTGVPGLHVSRSATGRRTLSAGIPGTGFRYRKSLNVRPAGKGPRSTDSARLTRAETQPADPLRHIASDLPRRSRVAKFLRTWLWLCAMVGFLASFDNNLNRGTESASAGSQPVEAAVSITLAAILWFTRHPRVRAKVTDDVPPAGRLEARDEVKRLELQAQVAMLQDLQKKFSEAQAQPQSEIAFLQAEVKYLDPSHPGQHDQDFGTLSITSRGVSFVSETTTQTWDFDKLVSVMHVEGDHFARIFAVRNRQNNSGISLTKNSADRFDDYFRAALAVRHPEQVPGDIKSLLEAAMATAQSDLAALRD